MCNELNINNYTDKSHDENKTNLAVNIIVLVCMYTCAQRLYNTYLSS